MSVHALDPTAAPPEVNSDTTSAIDLEKVPVDRVLAQLAVKPDHGLSSANAKQRFAKYGPNALVEKEESLFRKIVGHFTGPIAYMIEAAAIVSAIIGHWDDFTIIIGLLFFNAALELWQDRKASNALAALKKGLAPEATVLRDGKWQTRRSRNSGPRRHRQDPPRRHRARRSAARRRRLRLDRPVRADRRVAARGQEVRRRGLFRQRSSSKAR